MRVRDAVPEADGEPRLLAEVERLAGGRPACFGPSVRVDAVVVPREASIS